jgi:O-antigen/teichoic acid export membrane protein
MSIDGEVIGAPVLQKAAEQADRPSSGRRLAVNTIYNLVGLGAPTLVALAAIPRIVTGLGVDRFGVLSLAWMFLGYFSLFDLGLGQSLTQLVSEKLGGPDTSDVPPLVWTALSLMFLLGILGSGAILLVTPYLVHGILKVPAPLQAEAVGAFLWIAFSLPFDISTAGLQGVLAAHQRFGAISAVRTAMGLVTFLGPLLALVYSKDLSVTVGVLTVGRIAAWLAYLIICLRTMPGLRGNCSLRYSSMGRLIRFGGWMTVSNIISPLMTYMDRFLIGALMSVTAVAYYTTPYDMVARLTIVPAAMAGVLFPAFSADFATDKVRVARVFDTGLKCIFLMMFPVVFLIVAFSREGLELWLGAGFAAHGARTLQVLCVGILFNCLARIPYSLVQGAGRPDLTAKFHFIELALYLPLVWWAIGSYGILGAAAAWTLRVFLDAAILFALSRRLLPGSSLSMSRLAIPSAGAVLACVSAAALTEVAAKAIFAAVVLLFFALASAALMLKRDEKEVPPRRLKFAEANSAT